jgi:hypothetical protein
MRTGKTTASCKPLAGDDITARAGNINEPGSLPIPIPMGFSRLVLSGHDPHEDCCGETYRLYSQKHGLEKESSHRKVVKWYPRDCRDRLGNHCGACTNLSTATAGTDEKQGFNKTS